MDEEAEHQAQMKASREAAIRRRKEEEDERMQTKEAARRKLETRFFIQN